MQDWLYPGPLTICVCPLSKPTREKKKVCKTACGFGNQTLVMSQRELIFQANDDRPAPSVCLVCLSLSNMWKAAS